MILHAGGAERLVASAGGLLVAHVDNVRTLVDSSLNDTQASLLALPQAIGNLGKAAAMFVPSLDLDSTLKNKVTAPKGSAVLACPQPRWLEPTLPLVRQCPARRQTAIQWHS